MADEEVLSVIPVEETIIDPLYEPLKLNRYKLCPHLQRLKDISHLRYGFSPYLLFDVVWWEEVVKVIKKDTGLEEELQNKCEKILKDNDDSTNLEKYLELFEKGPPDQELRNTYYGHLNSKRDAILKEFKGIKERYQDIFDDFLYSPTNEFKKENFDKIAHLFRLEYPVKVKCPLCEAAAKTNPNVKPYMFMCEEGKIYSIKEALLRTFELRRARWLYMSGSLHTVHRAATHTRLSHEIGSMIVAVNALREIDVYPYGDMSMSLGEYLLMRGELHEFLMVNFLHDLGQAPLSHVLEVNPFIELNHEEITRNLILGEEPEEGKMDWYVTERYLLKMKAIKDFEYRFLENRYDPIYDVGEGKGWTKEGELRDNFLDYVVKNHEILESEVITVKEVLDNFGVYKERVVEILSGKVLCPKCKEEGKKVLAEIEKEYVRCKECGWKEEIIEIEKKEPGKIYDTQFLNKFIESEIDFDRVDHVKRDSVVCGLSLISFRLLGLLGSISVVLPRCKVYEEIHAGAGNKPYISISEDGLLYVMDLLTARRSVFRDILYSDENNWINGVVNQITTLAMGYLPHLRNMLPFITDQILMHFYTNDLFLGTQIEKLNKLFHGKIDYSAYDKPTRFKLKDGIIVTKKDLQKMYKKIEDINDEEYASMEFPAVVFYTNIKPTKCPNCGKKGTLAESEKMLCPSCKKELYKKEPNAELICENKNCDRFERTIKPEDAIKVLECKECGAFSIIIAPSEDLENINKCPFYQEDHKGCGGEMKKVRRNLIECGICGKKICKLIDEGWDDMLVYDKKFKIDSKEKYFKFKKLVGKYEEASRERFPVRPSERDVKNLFYVWVSDFAITEEKNREKRKNEIKEEIGGIWAGDKNEGIKEFDKRFVDLGRRRFHG